MKLWPTTTENKYFVKILWHLLDECVKVTILLVCSSDTVATTFFLFLFSSIFRLYFFFFLLNIYKNSYIYCFINITNFIIFLYYKNGYAATVLRHCASRVLTLCSTITATVFFFFPSNQFVYFFSFKYWCKLTFILLYWHSKFHNIFTIIEVSISYKSKIK